MDKYFGLFCYLWKLKYNYDQNVILSSLYLDYIYIIQEVKERNKTQILCKLFFFPIKGKIFKSKLRKKYKKEKTMRNSKWG